MSSTLGNLFFSPELGAFSNDRGSKPLTVLAGANNTGKSLALKWLKQTIGRTAYMVGSNRFYHVHVIQTALRDPTELDQFENQFASQFLNEQYNYEQNYIDLSRVLTGLSDKRRSELFSICGELLDSPISLKKVDDENELSMRYVEVGTQNLSVASTGARLLLTLLGICMDDRFETILVDEPELGLSPKVQQRLAELFQDEKRREAYFPHIKRMFIATHSQLLLDRTDVTNNFVVSKVDNLITISPVETLYEFHRLQFNLLGNSLDALFLPAAIIVVEGKSDHQYLERVVQLHFPSRRITVMPAQGNVKERIHSLRQAFGELQHSPFQARIFVVLDAVHPHGLVDELTAMGVASSNIIVWTKNGIEFLYPDSIILELFRGAPIHIEGDRVVGAGVTLTKADLGSEVTRRLDASTPLPNELTRELIARVTAAID